MNPAGYPYTPLSARPGGTWPNGARLAVVVCVGVESYRFGAGHTEDVIADVSAPDLVNTAWRDYGNRIGAFRLFDLLARLGIPPTVLLNTDVYDEAPDVLEAARKVSAEIVGHGRSNSDSLAGMTPEVERAYLADVADRIRVEEGQAPGGWSSPWLTQTPATLNLLADTGYEYLLDLRFDDQPVWLHTESGPLLTIPYAAELNDSSTMVGRSVLARDFADMIDDEFAELHAAAAHTPLVMSVVLHSFITGVPFRLRAVGRALERIAATEGVWLTTPRHIHRAVLDHPETFGE
ncbi:polysaccharide deacetylase family protein [Mycobacterium yunnanensis]|uniref:Polysaccharide deacetylase family protein n=1 Tax=Mycobacterium yunnanensis TaxID=368477 RepID=A0A9X2Z828_9MYCO|nr:polysaccharide deacetylase family protein [Mycobacterium yunnanensis]MCV7423864.1 polysaccharide deacetylase family protein [Mycobacterium yunnanensis]